MSLPIADGFWSVRTINDVVGIAGLVLGVGSIWFAWYLARKEFRKRLEEATRESKEAVRKVAFALSQATIIEAIRCFRDTRDSIRTRDWNKAIFRLEDGRGKLAKISASRRMEEAHRPELAGEVDNAKIVHDIVLPMIGANAKPNLTGPKQAQAMQRLIGIILFLERMEAIHQIEPLEVFYEPTPPPRPPETTVAQASGTDEGRKSEMGRPGKYFKHRYVPSACRCWLHSN